MSGLLDFKIQHPHIIDDLAGEVEEVMGMAVDLHAGVATLEAFDDLSAELEEYPELLAANVLVKKDAVTADVSRPEYSTSVAELLQDELGGQDALFIALGNGAITSGIRTYLDYLKLTDSEASAIYPVRFSTAKKMDEVPQLSEDEADYLIDLAAQRDRVVVFDEDMCTGYTMRRATRFFNKLLSTETVPAANRAFAMPGLGDVSLVGAKELRDFENDTR